MSSGCKSVLLSQFRRVSSSSPSTQLDRVPPKGWTTGWTTLQFRTSWTDEPWAILSNLRIEGMAVEDGPLLGAHSALRAFALHLKWCVPAITPDVPFCAAARMAMIVVLARCSGPDWV